MKYIVAAALALGVASATPIAPRQGAVNNATSCHTVHTGFITVFPGSNPTSHVPVGINPNNQVTYGHNDPRFQVDFQACPASGTQYPNLDHYTGRIIKTGTDTCVTVSNPAVGDSGPFYLEVSACQSDTAPPPAQYWEYGNDFGAVVFWMGSDKSSEIGWTDDANSEPVTEVGTGRIALGCGSTSCSSFNITPLDQLGSS